MRRVALAPRAAWERRVAEAGLVFHSGTDGTPYWREGACYELSLAEVETIEQATAELHARCLDAVDEVITKRRYTELAIPPRAVTLIEQSWEEEPPSLYGRFDFSWAGASANGTPPKMLEYNADTPTSLLEAAVVQWHWLEDTSRGHDQFNALHDRLVAGWRDLAPHLRGDLLHFASLDTVEDAMTTTYLRDTAQQAGLRTAQLSMAAVGWNHDTAQFVDDAGHPMTSVFKLYPWEWLVAEEFGQHLETAARTTLWIEPAWKMLLSNKGILPILWELFPDHPNLLECHAAAPGPLARYARKPMLSREGANVTLVGAGPGDDEQGADLGYGDEGWVYQALAPLPEFDQQRPVIGSWVVQGEPAGVGIRESAGGITGNASCFVPHRIA